MITDIKPIDSEYPRIYALINLKEYFKSSIKEKLENIAQKEFFTDRIITDTIRFVTDESYFCVYGYYIKYVESEKPKKVN